MIDRAGRFRHRIKLINSPRIRNGDRIPELPLLFFDAREELTKTFRFVGNGKLVKNLAGGKADGDTVTVTADIDTDTQFIEKIRFIEEESITKSGKHRTH